MTTNINETGKENCAVPCNGTEKYFTPATDVSDTKDALVIEMDLPGVEKNGVKIEIDENNILSVNAKQSYSEPDSIALREFTTGNFYRAFTLSDDFERDSIKASFEDGVLKLQIPRKEEQKPKKIEITL